MSELDNNAEDGEGGFDAEALDWEHIDQGGDASRRRWRLGVADLERIPFGGQGLWQAVGPHPLFVGGEQIYQGLGPNAGQVVDIAIDPCGGDNATLYIATNSGGVWKSSDGGSSWEALTDFLPGLSIGAVALDPGDPGIIYAGTGNIFEGGGGIVKAAGLFKSTDGGRTWAHMDGGIYATRFADFGIHRIVCPAPNQVLVATQAGLYLSVNGGQNFGANAPGYDDGHAIHAGFITALTLDSAYTATLRVVNATPTTPVNVQCTQHGFQTGDRVYIGGVVTNRAANGGWLIDVVDADHFTLRDSFGNGAGAVSGMVIGPRHPRTLGVSDATHPAGPQPIVVRATAHGLVSGDIVAVHGVAGNTNANGSWEVRVLDADRFELVGSRGNAAYTPGTGTVEAPTHAAAQAITAAANLPGNRISLTVTGHGLNTGDRVTVTGLPGVAEPNNSGLATVTDADHVVIAGQHLSGAYAGAGATLSGPAQAWNTAYFAVAGRILFGNAAHPDRGLYRLTLTSAGSHVESRNLFSGAAVIPANYNRVSFAQSTLPHARTLYAAIQDGKTRATATFVGLFRSEDFGRSWSAAPGTALAPRLTFERVNQSFYDLTLGVDPQDPQRVCAGLKQLWRSTDGGASWPTTRPETDGGDRPDWLPTTKRTAPSICKLHWDHHELTFVPATHWRWTSAATPALIAPTSLYLGTDGGIARSDDTGDSYVHLNDGLATALFKHIDIGRGATNNAATFGGMQDTGTAGHRRNAPRDYWLQGVDGDGDIVAVDPANADIVYGFDNGAFMRTTDGGQHWFRKAFGDIDDQPVVVAVRDNHPNPIEIETLGHAFKTGDTVTISGIRRGGTLVAVANGNAVITVVDQQVFRLNGKNGGAAGAYDAQPQVNGGRYPQNHSITAATLTAPIEIETVLAHGMTTGDRVIVEGVAGNAAANNLPARPTWTITLINATRFSLDGSDGRLASPYVRNSGRVRGPRVIASVPVTLATNANPIVVTAPGHDFADGEQVTIAGVRGNTAANVVNQAITVLDHNSFRLDGVAGNGNWLAAASIHGSSLGRGLPAVTDDSGGLRRRITIVPNGGMAATTVYVSVQNQLFRSRDAGISFAKVPGPQANGNFPTEISVLLSPSDTQLWVGLFGRPMQGTTAAVAPRVYFSADATTGPATHWLGAADNFVHEIGAHTGIGAIAVDPRDPLRVAVTTTGYSQTHPLRRTRHCFLTTTGGKRVGATPAWTEISGSFTSPDNLTNLPDLPVMAAAFDGTTNPATLLVASDAGVLRQTSTGWERIGPNFPNASCQGLAVDNTVSPAVIRVGTYGRSVFEWTRPSGPRLVVRTQMSLGERRVGQVGRVAQWAHLHNVGASPLSIASLDTAIGDFTLTPAPASFPVVIAPGAAVHLDLNYKLTVAGQRGAIFAVTSDDPYAAYVEFKVSAFGVTTGLPRLSVRPSMDFGRVNVGDSVDIPLEITNTGLGDLTFTTLAPLAPIAVISVTGMPATLPTLHPGDQLTLTVTYAPTADGHSLLELQIDTNGGWALVNIVGDASATGSDVLASILQFLGLAEPEEEYA